jgi:YebC/PmpR family DNA-binding regulatory protein
MGRIFEKRKYKMFARWARTARAFTKIGKEISIAVKLGGADPNGNPRLRMAVQTARSLNMPKDRIEAAVSRASGKDGESLSEIAYEGYGPHGVAILVETATDNPTRTVANVRASFDRYGGALAASGSLDYLFQRRGVFTVARPKGDVDELQLELIDHGLEDLIESDDELILYTTFTGFGTLQRALEERGLEVKNAGLMRQPNSTVEISAAQEAEVMKLIEVLEEDDDVQHVYHAMQSTQEGDGKE